MPSVDRRCCGDSTRKQKALDRDRVSERPQTAEIREGNSAGRGGGGGGVSSLARQGLWARPQGEMVQGCLGAFVLCTSIISSLLGFPTSNCTHCSVSIALAQGWSGIMSH